MAPTSRKRRRPPGGREVSSTGGELGSAAAGGHALTVEGTSEPSGRRLRGEARDELLRAELIPLAPGERPRPLLIATVVCGLLAVGVLAGTTTQSNLSSHGGSLIGGLFIAGVLALVCGGMFNRRYWAVLGFEALLAFQIIVSCLALTVVASWLVALVLVVVVGLAGWLFWKLVRVMGRLQVTTEFDPPNSA